MLTIKNKVKWVGLLGVIALLILNATKQHVRLQRGSEDTHVHQSEDAHVHQPREMVFSEASHVIHDFGGIGTPTPPEIDKIGATRPCGVIRYAFSSVTEDITRDEVEEAIREAADMWEAVIDMKFVELEDDHTQHADIVIGWERGDHGDEYPAFDGDGDSTFNILGYASFLVDDEDDDDDGDFSWVTSIINFDEDDSWVMPEDDEDGIDLVTIAAHEFGHALGLGHSSIESALMAPAFDLETHRRPLAQDDIDAVRSKYGHCSSSASRWIAPDYGSNVGPGSWQVGVSPRMMADVNGDGMDDVVGFGHWGVSVSLSTGEYFTAQDVWIRQFGYETGWRVEKHTRMMADVNGDGMDDVVGFGDEGVVVSLSTGSDFTDAEVWTHSFGYNSEFGWRVEEHPRMMADVNGDGMADVVGFGTVGVYVSLSTGSGFTDAKVWIHRYGYDTSGWRVDQHPRMMSDVNGDGMDDIVGFAGNGIAVSLSTGSGFTNAEVWTHSFGYNTEFGWRIDQHPRMMSDVNGDGMADVVGFGTVGVYVSLSTGSGFTNAKVWIHRYGYDTSGWRVDQHPRMMADVNGDGMDDIVGFASANVVYSLSSGSSFGNTEIWLDYYGYSSENWRVEQHVRSLADVNGDGKADIVGFGDFGVDVFRSPLGKSIVGDWDGDGHDNMAIRRGNMIYMDTNFDSNVEQSHSFGLGHSEDEYLFGDWDGDGRDNVAIRRGNQINMDTNFDGVMDVSHSFGLGNSEDEYLVGDWDGDGRDNVAIRRNNVLYMDTTFDGKSDISHSFGLGNSEDEYLVGDWDGDGRDNVAVRRGNRINMDTTFDGKMDMWQLLGVGDEDEYLVGDWDGDNRDNIAVRNGSTLQIDTDFNDSVDLTYELPLD